MAYLRSTEPFGTSRYVDRWDAYGNPTPAYERFLDWQESHAKCECCGEEFHVDELEDGMCGECREGVL